MEVNHVDNQPTTAGEQEWTLRKGYLQAPDGTQYPSLSQELVDAINADLAAEQLDAAVEALKHVAQLADDQIAGIANDALAKIEGK